MMLMVSEEAVVSKQDLNGESKHICLIWANIPLKTLLIFVDSTEGTFIIRYTAALIYSIIIH